MNTLPHRITFLFVLIALAGCGRPRLIIQTGATTESGEQEPDTEQKAETDTAKKTDPVTSTELNNTISVTKAGSGTVTGTVTGITPSPIRCGTICSASLASTSSIRLYASPATGQRFKGWTGACSGTVQSCTLTLAAARQATATFEVAPTSSISISKMGAGTISGGPIQCGSTCTGTVVSGTSLTLLATPAEGQIFAGWSGACSGLSSSCTISVSSDKLVAATFIPMPVLEVPDLAYSVSGGFITLTWIDDNDLADVADYNLQASQDGVNWVTLARVSPQVPHAFITTPAPSYYRMMATSASPSVGSSGWSTIIQVN